MAVKIFVLGLPGSGKSTVVRYISKYARDNAAFVKSTGNKNREVHSLSWLKKLVRFLTTFKEQSNKQWSTTHITDYDILYQMFQEDTQGQFEPADFGGFDIIDLSAFDVALKSLEQQVNEYISTAKSTEIILIEFSRNDYQRAFQQFSHASFLKDAYFLYLDANIETCKRRIRERITHPTSSDDHFVSEYIFGTYYYRDNGRCLSNILEKDYMLDKQRVLVIDNNCSLELASRKIDPFIDLIIDLSSDHINTADMSSSDFDESIPDDVADSSANNLIMPATAKSEVLVDI